MKYLGNELLISDFTRSLIYERLTLDTILPKNYMDPNNVDP